eukprot:scaffold119678_cov33-Tisochrysis_lutea.AAC.1
MRCASTRAHRARPHGAPRPRACPTSCRSAPVKPTPSAALPPASLSVGSAGGHKAPPFAEWCEASSFKGYASLPATMLQPCHTPGSRHLVCGLSFCGRA